MYKKSKIYFGILLTLVISLFVIACQKEPKAETKQATSAPAEEKYEESVIEINKVNCLGVELPPSAFDEKGETPLTKIMSDLDRRTYFPIFVKLLEQGVNVNEPNQQGDYPITLAATHYNASYIKYLIQACADVNVVDHDKNSALIITSMKGDLKTVKELLAAKADPNIINGEGRTALIYAATGGYKDIAENLLKAGADPNIEVIANGQKLGLNALEAAKLNNHKDIEELLKQYGAKEPEIPVFENKSLDNISAENINNKDDNGFTPLLNAILSGNNEQAKQLINMGADVNVEGPNIGTPLMLACSINNTEVVEALIAAKANLNYIAPSGYTPLMMATQMSYTDLVKKLIAAGADVNFVNEANSFTALKVARNIGNTEIEQILIQAGAKE